jgi:integrase
MATIRKLESGRFQAILRRKGYPEKSKTFTAEIDAENWAKAVELARDRGTWADDAEAETTTLDDLLDRYAKSVSKKKKGAEAEGYRIRTWRADPLAKKSVASLKPADFAKWRDDRLAAGVAAATVRNDLAVVAHCLQVAIREWGIGTVNPVRAISLPRQNNSRDRRLEGDEEARLMAALDSPAGDRSNPWIGPIVSIAIETAMRQGEILKLTWGDLDLARRVARLSDTKNGQSRDVPLSPAAVAVFEAMARPIKGGGAVFPTTASALKQSFMRACTRAKIVDLTFHDLRHEATSRLAEKLALHELMKVTGHSDTRMLARYYHPRAEDLAKKLG